MYENQKFPRNLLPSQCGAMVWKNDSYVNNKKQMHVHKKHLWPLRFTNMYQL